MSDFLNPQKVINELELQETMSIADFGCGSGGWVIPLARKDKNHMIYALDVLEPALSALKSNAEMEKVYNIRTIRCDVEKGTGLRDDFLDVVIMSNLLFQVEDREAVLDEGRRVLRKGGRLVVVDWIIEGDNGEEELDRVIKEKEFGLIKSINSGESHFAKIYEKI